MDQPYSTIVRTPGQIQAFHGEVRDYVHTRGQEGVSHCGLLWQRGSEGGQGKLKHLKHFIRKSFTYQSFRIHKKAIKTYYDEI